MNDAVRFLSDIAHANHPDLVARKHLAARVLLARNLHVLANEKRLPRKSVKNLVLTGQVKIDIEAKNSNKTLTVFLEEVVTAIKAQWESDRVSADTSTQMEHAAIELLLSQLSQEAVGLSCHNCMDQRGEKTQCEGKVADAHIVAQRATCLDFVTTVFAFLVKLAESFYQPLLRPTPSGELVIRLQTKHTNGRALEASTRFVGDGPLERRAQVHVKLPLRFNATHLKRLPYLLFHEIFVHAPEAWGAASFREATAERCAFREGFVDAAALHVLQHGLRDLDVVPHSHHDFAEPYRRESRSAHRDRISHGPAGVELDDEEDDLVAIRESGSLAFDRLAESDLAKEAVDLAICINSLPLCENERTRIVVALCSMTAALRWTDSNEQPGRTRWIELHRNVLHAVRTGNARELADRLLVAVDPSEF